MALGTLASIILGVTALGATTAIATSAQKSAEKKANNEAQAGINKAKQEAEQKALMDSQAEEKTKTARKALLDTPTSGFGPNTNLARSFLTTL